MADDGTGPGTTELGDPGTGTSGGDGTTGTADSKPTLHEVDVGGEKSKVSTEDLIRGYQKAQDSDRKYQESAEGRKLEGDFKAMKDGDEGAFRRIAQRMDWPEERIGTAIKAHRQQQIREAMEVDDNDGTGDSSGGNDGGGVAGGVDSTGDGNQGAGGSVNIDQIAMQVAEKLLPALKQNFKVGFDNLDPRFKEALGPVISDNLEGNFTRGLESDAELGIMMKEGSDDQKEELREMVLDEARKRASAGDNLRTPETRNAILQKVKRRLARMGVKPGKAPVPPGLGSSRSGSPIPHYDKPLERPDGGMDDPSYDDYVMSILNSPGEEI